MAHYALLDENNVVIQVITGVDENIIQTDLDGTQVGGSSEAWENFYATRPWFNATSCKRTSYNHNIRKSYAAIGYSYDPIADVFFGPQPYPSWSLDANHDWQPPTPMPTEGVWIWNEDTQSWDEVELPIE
jgi:hypothetical protein